MAVVVAVARSGRHSFTKPTADDLRLVAGVGVMGDVHAGAQVQHTYVKRRHPQRPNLRQVHLLGGELHDELVARGFGLGPGVMGENVTTRGVDLIALPLGTTLRLGAEATVELTGVRTPCAQLDAFMPGLMAAVIEKRPGSAPVFRCGVMAVVRTSGIVCRGDVVEVVLPPGAPVPLPPV